MRDLELFRQQLLERPLDGLRLADVRRVHDHMRCQGYEAGTEAPDVQIVDTGHGRDVLHRLHHSRRLNLFRCPLHQHVERFPQQSPGALKDEAGDQETDDGIHGRPTGQRDDDGGHDDPHRTQRVSQHVEKSAADVEIVVVVLPQH